MTDDAVAVVNVETAVGVAELPVTLPITLLAAKFANIAKVTALFAIVVDILPADADPVTFPVKVIVGKSPAARILKADPVVPFAAKNCVAVAEPDPMSVPCTPAPLGNPDAVFKKLLTVTYFP